MVTKQQFAQGESKRINHTIALARDAIYAANQRKHGCAIANLDFKAAFDFLGMEWVFEVLRGCSYITLSVIMGLGQGKDYVIITWWG